MSFITRSIDTLRARGFFTYGTVIPGLTLYGKPAPYPVLNERAIRAGAGVMFAVGFFSFIQAVFVGNYAYMQFAVPFFFFDFMMKVIVGTRFSPIGYIGRLLVRGQEPEYVGAIQKRFAWTIGLLFSGTVLLLSVVLEIRSMVSMVLCTLCLTFMFLESAAGICVGCKIYGWLLRIGVIATSQYRPVCPGNVCAIE